MKTKHTPEQWMVDDGLVDMHAQGAYIVEDIGSRREWVAVGTIAENRIDEVVALAHPNTAARIVACVNACAGMDDPVREVKELKAYNDVMNECLKLIDLTSTAKAMLKQKG